MAYWCFFVIYMELEVPVGEVSVGDMSYGRHAPNIREISGWGCVRSGKCLAGKCSVGEVSFRNVSVGEVSVT